MMETKIQDLIQRIQIGNPSVHRSNSKSFRWVNQTNEPTLHKDIHCIVFPNLVAIGLFLLNQKKLFNFSDFKNLENNLQEFSKLENDRSYLALEIEFFAIKKLSRYKKKPILSNIIEDSHGFKSTHFCDIMFDFIVDEINPSNILYTHPFSSQLAIFTANEVDLDWLPGIRKSQIPFAEFHEEYGLLMIQSGEIFTLRDSWADIFHRGKKIINTEDFKIKVRQHQVESILNV